MVRLQKYLADAGICSRRKAEELILEGKVIVNNQVVKELGVKIDEGDEVKYKGKVIKVNNEKVYLILNKPVGYVTTVDDELERPTVMEFIKKVKQRVYPVGRLDYNSSGLLLLTNDGEITNKLTHPSHELQKVYQVKVRGVVSEAAINKFKSGVIIDGKKTLPAEAKIIEASEKWTKLEVGIKEGRNRQIRKMFEVLNYPVVKLKRISIGKLTLENLQPGDWRYLRPYEIEYLKNLK